MVAVPEGEEERMYITMVIIASALVTIFVETAIFMMSREYRNRRFVLASVIVNATTNIILNVCFLLSGKEFELISFPVLLAEAIVFITEFIAYGLWFRFTWKLMAFVFLANLVTYSMSFLF
jgi:hypothetical protein